MRSKVRKSLIRHYERKKEWHIREMERTGNQEHMFDIVECDEKIAELEEDNEGSGYFQKGNNHLEEANND